ncbi:hypothetical protein [Pseudooceanicola onchidii]|uniref:hypothetical protein n=1 Tax=Pseudooceanicola onchidii TaxID=2562279 RepID=UPI0010AA4A48|nr:hypothetical protein [Pseudooceanicola onchidii]
MTRASAVESLHVLSVAHAQDAAAAWRSSREDCDALKAELYRIRRRVSSLSNLIAEARRMGGDPASDQDPDA